MATKLKRIMITISDENLRRLESVYARFGISKSAQVQSLIVKHLETEFGQIESQKGEVHEDK